MLDVIRANAQSWGVKVAFAIIIIVFVFWGVGGMSGNSGTVIVTVNDEPVTTQEFIKAYEVAERSVRDRNPGIDAEGIKQMGLRAQVLQQLVLTRLLQQEAARAGITITPVELRQAIELEKAFQNQEGKFDPQIYLQMLKAQHIAPGDFENDVRTQLLGMKLQRELTAGAFVEPELLREQFIYEGEQRGLEFIPFPQETYTDKVTVTPEELKAFYDTKTQYFNIPAQAQVEYLLIGAKTLAAPQSVTDAAIKEFYDKHIEQYTRPARLRASHILILADEKAGTDIHEAAKKTLTDIEKRLNAGEDFAALAKEFSQDPGSAEKGGDLDWFTADQMVKPFADAASALKPGQISGIVQSPFGYHIIKLVDAAPAGPAPLADVSDEIRTRLAQESAAGKVQESLEQVQLAVIGGKSLKDAGAPHKLDVIDTGLTPTSELAAKMGIKPAELTTLLASKAGTTSETPLLGKDGYIIASVKASNPAGRKPFEEVSKDITAMLTREKSIDLALADAEKVRTTLGDTLPESLKKRVAKSELIGRNAPYIMGDTSTPTTIIGEAPELIKAMFADTTDKWLPGAYKTSTGAVIARVAEHKTPTDENWKASAGQIQSMLTESRQQQMFSTYLQLLQQGAKIEMKNPSILEN